MLDLVFLFNDRYFLFRAQTMDYNCMIIIGIFLNVSVDTSCDTIFGICLYFYDISMRYMVSKYHPTCIQYLSLYVR